MLCTSANPRTYQLPFGATMEDFHVNHSHAFILSMLLWKRQSSKIWMYLDMYVLFRVIVFFFVKSDDLIWGGWSPRATNSHKLLIFSSELCGCLLFPTWLTCSLLQQLKTVELWSFILAIWINSIEGSIIRINVQSMRSLYSDVQSRLVFARECGSRRRWQWGKSAKHIKSTQWAPVPSPNVLLEKFRFWYSSKKGEDMDCGLSCRT